jgi:hypothetical protein
LLGLSLRFIPIPRMNVPWKAFEEHNFAHFDREIKVKVFMADHEDNGTYNSAPPPWKIPLEITRRLQSFKEAIKKLVKPKKSPRNLLIHQKKALKYL